MNLNIYEVATIAVIAPTPAVPVGYRECPDRPEAIRRIKTALERRSGKRWSVTGGTGTAWGWLRIDAPPARRTWSRREIATDDPCNPRYEDYDTGERGHGMSPTDRAELGALLGLGKPVHHQGHSVPSSSDYYLEAIDRAEGRTPAKIAEPYWD